MGVPLRFSWNLLYVSGCFSPLEVRCCAATSCDPATLAEASYDEYLGFHNLRESLRESSHRIPKFSIWSICFCSWLRHNIFMALTRELLYLTRVFISLLVLQHTSWAVNIHSPSLSAVQEMRIFFPSFDRWIGPTAMKRCWWVAWLEVPWQLLEGRSNRSWKLCYLHWLMVF